MSRRDQQKTCCGKDGDGPPECAGLRERRLCGRLGRRVHRRLYRRIGYDEGSCLLRDGDGIALRRQLHDAPVDDQAVFVVPRKIIPGIPPAAALAEGHGIPDLTVFQQLDRDRLRALACLSLVVPALQDLALFRVVRGRRGNGRACKFERDGHIILPGISRLVQIRQADEERLCVIHTIPVGKRLASHEIQARQERLPFRREGQLTVLIGHAAVQRRQPVALGIGGQRLRKRAPRSAVQPVESDGILHKIAGQRKLCIRVDIRYAVKRERRAGDRRSILLITDREADGMCGIDSCGGQRRNRQCKNQNQRE